MRNIASIVVLMTTVGVVSASAVKGALAHEEGRGGAAGRVAQERRRQNEQQQARRRKLEELQANAKEE